MMFKQYLQVTKPGIIFGNLIDLASRVQPLFSTDFYREKWLVEIDP